MQGIIVEYLAHMGEDLTVSNVARCSFNRWKDEFDEKDAKLINYLADHGHSSPFRHNSVQIRCTAPIFLARQLMKHQVGLSWNEISRRYVDTDIEFFYPEVWRSRPENGLKQGSGTNVVATISAYDPEFNLPIELAYGEFIEEALNLYERMISVNVAPEMARMVLPQSMLTTWIWTGSLQAFHHVYSLRSGEGAQEEAKEFAEKLHSTIEPLFPVAWKALNK